MAKNKKTESTKMDAVVPTPSKSEVVLEEQTSNEPVTFVVVRNGLRVSDREYIDPADPAALAEKTLWSNVVKKFPDGTKVAVVQYNKKLHRVW